MRCAPFIVGIVVITAGVMAIHHRVNKARHWAVNFQPPAAVPSTHQARHPGHRVQPMPALQPARPAAAPATVVQVVDNTTPNKSGYAFQFIVAGHPQLSHEDAVEAAFEDAQQKIGQYLTEQKLASDWQPPVEYLKDHLLRDLHKSEIERNDVRPIDPMNDIGIDSRGRGQFWAVEAVTPGADGSTPLYQVTLRVAAGPEQLAEMQAMAHHERMADRMVPLARALGCLVALFAAIGLYIRFDELTKGYYRTVLRLGATGFVAAAWVALAWPVIHLLLGG